MSTSSQSRAMVAFGERTCARAFEYVWAGGRVCVRTCVRAAWVGARVCLCVGGLGRCVLACSWVCVRACAWRLCFVMRVCVLVMARACELVCASMLVHALVRARERISTWSVICPTNMSAKRDLNRSSSRRGWPTDGTARLCPQCRTEAIDYPHGLSPTQACSVYSPGAGHFTDATHSAAWDCAV